MMLVHGVYDLILYFSCRDRARRGKGGGGGPAASAYGQWFSNIRGRMITGVGSSLPLQYLLRIPAAADGHGTLSLTAGLRGQVVP